MPKIFINFVALFLCGVFSVSEEGETEEPAEETDEDEEEEDVNEVGEEVGDGASSESSVSCTSLYVPSAFYYRVTK